MNWGNPIAWLGALTVLLPILVHFFTRRPGRVEPFPSLRFVPKSRLLPAWSRKPSDLLLMVVRMAVLLLATTALARPLLPTGSATAAGVAARLVLVDSSWSMHQQSGNATPFDSAQDVARVLADSAGIARVVITADPAVDLDAAAAWLDATDATTRELVIVSDFQRGTVDSIALAQIPERVGIRTVRVPNAPMLAQRITARVGNAVVDTDFEIQDGETVVRYSRRGVPASQQSRVGIARDESAMETGILRSVVSVGALPYVSNRDSATTITLYSATDTAWRSARARAVTIGSSSLAAIAASLAADPQVKEAAYTAGNALEVEATSRAAVTNESAERATKGDSTDTFVVLARNSAGDVVVDAARESSPQATSLMVFVHDKLLSPLSVSVLAALERGELSVVPVSEFDSATMSDVQLRQVMRAPVEQSTAIDDAEVGRWVWVLVLLALLVEWMLRRGKRLQAQEGSMQVAQS